MRKFIATFVGVALAIAVSLSPAAADTQYRYWSFWQAESGSWAVSPVGMMSIPAQEGLVLGWRFVTSGVNAPAELAPRASAEFASLCADAPTASEGSVTIAVVIDYGFATDYADGAEPPAPRTECTQVEAGTPSSLALASIAEIRENAGFVCALDSLPAEGCGDEVEVMPVDAQPLGAGAPETSETTVDETEQVWDMVATIVTTVLGVVVFVMAWRRMMLQKENKRRRQEGSE